MKRYYAEREQLLEPVDLNTLKSYFIRVYNQFFYEGYFAKERFDWAVIDPELYLFQKLQIKNIWPFEKHIETYDEATLFSVIEFLYEYVYYNLPYAKYYEDLKDGQKEYRNMVNDLLRFYNEGYKLSENGEIQKLSPPCFEALINEIFETNDSENIDFKVNYAISKFSRYNSSIEDKDAALIKLAGVLEYLQKRGIKLYEKDDDALFQIMNDFNIRHKNRKQHTNYDKDIWFDWMFYTFLASIHVLLKLNEKKFDLKIQHTE